MTTPPSVGFNSVVISVCATGLAVALATRNVWWGIAVSCALTSVLLGAFKIAAIMNVVRTYNETKVREQTGQGTEARGSTS